MKNKTKVLIVTQEMSPYLDLTNIAKIARQLPQHLQQKGMEIRVLMPRFGTINERRHRLHEVVRLSGINVIIDEDDFPLVIKVASLPGARMQVYFLDNDDFYKRKHVYRDGNAKFYDDNTERMIFFCKGVLETVKKFGWAPDVIHCHGWMTSLMPLYLKTTYQDDPIFSNAQVVYSLYNDNFDEKLTRFTQKALLRKVSEEHLLPYGEPNKLNLDKGAIYYSDAIVKADENLNEDIVNELAASDKLVLEHMPIDNNDYLTAYRELYSSLLENAAVQ